MGQKWHDYFNFKTMITGPSIKVIYVLGVIGSIAAALFAMCVSVLAILNSLNGYFDASLLISNILILPALVVFNILWRIGCEYYIVWFGMHEQLIKIEKKLDSSDKK